MPVEASVAAIFWAISPALPMPRGDHAAPAGEQRVDGAAELAVDAPRHAGQRLAFELR